MKLRSPYNYDRNEASLTTGLACDPEDDFTQQSHAEESDINTIVKRFGLTGQLPNGIAMPQSGDFTNVTDYQTAMNVIRAAEEAFMEIPAATRERFQHNPQKVMEFMENPENKAEAIKLGFIEKPAEQPRPAEPTATQ